jgi:TonB-linked SusC/RagA family outer membrane protein
MDFRALCACRVPYGSGGIVTKTWRIVKISAFIILAACLHVSASGTAQTVTYTAKSTRLVDIFAVIKQQTGYVFFYRKEDLQDALPVTVQLKATPLADALAAVLAGQPLGFNIQGNTIVIARLQNPVLPAGDTTRLPKQTVKVNGTVHSEAGEPLSGANVVIKELSKGTTTNAKGEFEIPAIAVGNSLVISYIGYAPQQIKIKEGGDLKIVLKTTKNELDRVVIQAYGETTQRLATGDIGTVRAEDIAKQPVMNVLDALQGQVPGTVVTNTSGYASGTIKVEIRGRSTINPNFPSDPLYIVDGVPLTILDLTGTSGYENGSPGFIQSGLQSFAGGQSPFFSINPSDIESIQVLKDADATAIYGSRGANGVILITTKKGKAGKTKFNVSAYQGETFITRSFPLLNTSEYIAMRKEALNNDGLVININNSPDLVVGDSTRYTNWQKYLWGGIGKETDIETSLSGGDAVTTFRLGAGYHYQRDLTTVSGGNSRGSVSLNLNHKSLDQRLNMSLTANYTFVATGQIALPGSPDMAPNAPPVFDKSGGLNFAGWDAFFGYSNANPFGTLFQTYSSSSNLLNSNLLLGFEALKGLSIRTSLGYNNVVTSQTEYYPIASQDPVGNPTGQANLGTSLSHNIIVEPQIEYNRFLGKGKLDGLVGATDQINTTTGSNLLGYGITNDVLLPYVAAAPSKAEFYGRGEYKYAGVFARLNYNWENKYIVNLNSRRDGSSRFGPGKQYGNFGSAGLAWIFSEENWFKKYLSFLSFGKLRASYGVTGSDNIGDYQYLTQWSFGLFNYNNVLPLIPQGHTDSVFHWQTVKKTEIAIDLGFLKDRITLSISWYLNRCNDQLLLFPTPEFTGFTGVTTNSPADVQNTGLELVWTTKVIDNKNFKWSTTFSIGSNRNKLVAYPNFSQSPYTSTYVIGQPLNIKRLLHNTGVDPQTGLYTFEDKNKDGKITYDPGQAGDDSYIYNMAVRFDGHLKLNFSYKNWDLSTFFYFRRQLGTSPIRTLDAPGDMTNQADEVLQKVWQKPGDIAQYARLTTSPSDQSYSNYLQLSDGVITDASFIRLQNLSVTYSLPKSKWNLKWIDNANVFVRAQNLLLITKYKGTDPEIQSFSDLPLPKIVTLGLNFNF